MNAEEGRVKSFIRKLVPQSMLARYGRAKRLAEQRKNREKSVEEVFTEIYRRNKWGGAHGDFCSGDGSISSNTVSSYVSMLTQKASTEGFLGTAFVDLGCGDFRVGRQLLPLCSMYTGVDVVKLLVQRNQEQYGNATTRFVHLDIVESELPDGEVCLLRQVLQHLSNAQIATVLKKLDKYSWVFITEHYPTDNDAIVPNLDKVHGGDVRVYENSGVYITEPPFELPAKALEQVLEVPGVGQAHGTDQGVIRTFLYKPGS